MAGGRIVLLLPGLKPSLPYTLLVSLIIACVLLWRIFQIGKRDPRLPPGPPTVPLLGNAHQIPLTKSYKKYVFLPCPVCCVTLILEQISRLG